MGIDEIRKDDVGTVFERQIKDNATIVDISGATSMQIIFQKPDDGVFVPKTAAFSSDGVDGKLRYVTIASDLDVIGVWQWQAKVTIPGGTWKTDILDFQVHENLEV